MFYWFFPFIYFSFHIKLFRCVYFWTINTSKGRVVIPGTQCALNSLPFLICFKVFLAIFGANGNHSFLLFVNTTLVKSDTSYVRQVPREEKQRSICILSWLFQSFNWQLIWSFDIHFFGGFEHSLTPPKAVLSHSKSIHSQNTTSPMKIQLNNEENYLPTMPLQFMSIMWSIILYSFMVYSGYLHSCVHYLSFGIGRKTCSKHPVRGFNTIGR